MVRQENELLGFPWPLEPPWHPLCCGIPHFLRVREALWLLPWCSQPLFGCSGCVPVCWQLRADLVSPSSHQHQVTPAGMSETPLPDDVNKGVSVTRTLLLWHHFRTLLYISVFASFSHFSFLFPSLADKNSSFLCILGWMSPPLSPPGTAKVIFIFFWDSNPPPKSVCYLQKSWFSVFSLETCHGRFAACLQPCRGTWNFSIFVTSSHSVTPRGARPWAVPLCQDMSPSQHPRTFHVFPGFILSICWKK